PDFYGAAEMRTRPLEPMHRRRAEQQRPVGEGVQAHAEIIYNRRYSGRGMRVGRPRLILAALPLVSLVMVTAGCAFEGRIGVQLVGGGPVGVTQSSRAEPTPHRLQ